MPKAPPSNGAAAASGKARALKYIPRTQDLARSNESARQKSKGKAKLVLKEVHELVKGVVIERFTANSSGEQPPRSCSS